MQTVSPSQIVDGREAVEEPLPRRIQEALGQLVGAAKEGLLALSVGVGLGVLEELMIEEVEEVCGARGKHDPDRTAYRTGPRTGRSRSAVGACRFSGRGCVRRTARKRCRAGPMSTSLHATRSRGSAGADARRRLDAPLPAGAGAGR